MTTVVVDSGHDDNIKIILKHVIRNDDEYVAILHNLSAV